MSNINYESTGLNECEKRFRVQLKGLICKVKTRRGIAKGGKLKKIYIYKNVTIRSVKTRFRLQNMLNKTPFNDTFVAQYASQHHVTQVGS